jgi:hypoxanthine-guanine phosphoribosyltransferase
MPTMRAPPIAIRVIMIVNDVLDSGLELGEGEERLVLLELDSQEATTTN